MKEQGAAAVILLEGSAAGKEPLTLAVTDAAGAEVFATRLNLSLDGVEQMFRHVNVIEAVGGPPPADLPNGARYGGVTSRFDEPQNLPDSETDNEKHFVLRHGYNVNGQEPRGFSSEIFKRLYWAGSKAKFWGVSWFGFETQNQIFHRIFRVCKLNCV
jgi:hypothetical protein